jgi:hypothetical protein
MTRLSIQMHNQQIDINLNNNITNTQSILTQTQNKIQE